MFPIMVLSFAWLTLYTQILPQPLRMNTVFFFQFFFCLSQMIMLNKVTHILHLYCVYCELLSHSYWVRIIFCYITLLHRHAIKRSSPTPPPRDKGKRKAIASSCRRRAHYQLHVVREGFILEPTAAPPTTPPPALVSLYLQPWYSDDPWETVHHPHDLHLPNWLDPLTVHIRMRTSIISTSIVIQTRMRLRWR